MPPSANRATFGRSGLFGSMVMGAPLSRGANAISWCTIERSLSLKLPSLSLNAISLSRKESSRFPSDVSRSLSEHSRSRSAMDVWRPSNASVRGVYSCLGIANDLVLLSFSNLDLDSRPTYSST
jgi:hypothetical protein